MCLPHQGINYTALHQAVFGNKLENLGILLGAGADAAIKTSYVS